MNSEQETPSSNEILAESSSTSFIESSNQENKPEETLSVISSAKREPIKTFEFLDLSKLSEFDHIVLDENKESSK